MSVSMMAWLVVAATITLPLIGVFITWKAMGPPPA